jgi:hypothetical protein
VWTLFAILTVGWQQGLGHSWKGLCLTILHLSTHFEEALPLVCANITLPFDIAPEDGPNRPRAPIGSNQIEFLISSIRANIR